MAEESSKYSMADQVARFANAKATGNQRYLNIETVYDGSYLKGKRVLITGCNRGLGLELAKEAAAQGAIVYAAVRKSSPDLSAIKGVEVIEGVDVTKTETMKNMVEALSEPLDIVVNNAGYFTEAKETIGNMLFEEELKQIDICAVGPLRVTSTLLNSGKLKQPGGHVVIITSQAGSAAWRRVQNKDEGGDYGHHMSRAACNIAGVLMSEELRKKGVFISQLHPGFNRTDMTAKFAQIWDIEGAVESSVGAKRVFYEIGKGSIETSGRFVNCEDGLEIPW
uniref:Short-chain dehydrogenase/reductase SDR n=1 Tax=Chromera velia CCMP2878 TaxID=1169474 RepID=A0A0G4FV05_9ALVE|eukprot:Cvel_18915.t1-p1 / transcript=Cvel_18915.t1 / gene=Cvel_18915 / organism=Chromera_velia_CCMP2878 / gene_product=C-factor, putative / transcript_product=C-factor, putative / location=Cvel_scaffold1594:33083-33919(+) / protein_length=279 / sequence_SO=supercontig / SO=protein_coding / is_pseudo=false